MSITKKDYKKFNEFRSAIIPNLIPYNDIYKNTENIICYLWDSSDINKFTEKTSIDINACTIYTVVDEDNEGYILKGKKFANRVGYLISTKDIPIDYSIRIW